MQHTVPARTGTKSWHPGSIQSLPFDIIHILLDYVSPIDLLNLCRTCKALYTHFQNDSIWKHLCASYGLRDFTHFGDITPRSIYTLLLYHYGGLLGLWAGNHPFTGSIMEYRIFPGDEHEQGGIIGEVWHFPRSETSIDDAIPPHYVRVLKISLASLPPDFTNSNANPAPSSATPQVHVLCDSDIPALHSSPQADSDSVHKVGTPHLSSLAFIPQSKTVHHLEFYRRTIDLPEFPKPDAAWFDPSPSRLLHLPALPDEPDADQRSIIKIFPALQLPKTWSSPTATIAHPAISIRCPHGHRCASYPARVPPPPFAALEPAHPQYFPLRLVPSESHEADPRSAGWTLDSLAGLWCGAYGAHGTEVLHLARGEAHWREGMCATKLTGDANVPCGAVSWMLEETDEYGDEPAEFWTELRGGERPPRVLTGRGLLASRGFADSNVIGIIAAVISADEIHIFWSPLQIFRIYRRYKGREEERHDGSRDE